MNYSQICLAFIWVTYLHALLNKLDLGPYPTQANRVAHPKEKKKKEDQTPPQRNSLKRHTDQSSLSNLILISFYPQCSARSGCAFIRPEK